MLFCSVLFVKEGSPLQSRAGYFTRGERNRRRGKEKEETERMNMREANAHVGNIRDTHENNIKARLRIYKETFKKSTAISTTVIR